MLKIKKNTTIQKTRWELCFSENSNKGDATPPVTQVSGVPASFSSTINHPNWNTGAHDAALGHFPLPGDVCLTDSFNQEPVSCSLSSYPPWQVSSQKRVIQLSPPCLPPAACGTTCPSLSIRLECSVQTPAEGIHRDALHPIPPGHLIHPGHHASIINPSRALPIIRTSNWTCLTTKSSTISFFPFPSPATAPFLCFDYGLFLKGVHKDAPSFYKMNFPLGNPAICLLLEDVCDLRSFFLTHSLPPFLPDTFSGCPTVTPLCSGVLTIPLCCGLFPQSEHLPTPWQPFWFTGQAAVSWLPAIPQALLLPTCPLHTPAFSCVSP